VTKNGKIKIPILWRRLRVKCPKCGQQVMSYYRFCWRCGTDLRKNPPIKEKMKG